MMQNFLSNHTIRPVNLSYKCPFTINGLYIGNGNQPLEVLLCTSKDIPNTTTIRSLWQKRKNYRAIPLLIVVIYRNHAHICGPTGEDAPVYKNIDIDQVKRICEDSLNLPDRHSVLRYLGDVLPSLDSNLPGINNVGFLATHELQYGVPKRSDWNHLQDKALNVLDKKGEELLQGLGYSVKKYNHSTSILESGETKTAIALLLKENESPELCSNRFSDLTPITYALHIAENERLPYVIIVQGRKIRLYPVDSSVGVGSRGRSETFIEIHTSLIPSNMAAYLWVIFSSEALKNNGFLENLLSESIRFSGDLATQLRDRIYNKVIPILCEGIVQTNNGENPSSKKLSIIYEIAISILYRLLFIAYAEDKDLLPYKYNGLYQKRSLKSKAQEINHIVNKSINYDRSDSLWEEISRLFSAVDKGNQEWDVPAYGGELFTSDHKISNIGGLISELKLPNTITGPVLENLLLVDSEEGLGPVDFRSLGVKEFGTIYEGLLESELSIAETDLSIDNQGFYYPSSNNDEVIINKGKIYLHNSSGARKSSGSFYTKNFAVDHLLEKSLIPAIKNHFSRLDSMDDKDAAKNFFDLKIADIAMGSGHFLINAIDKLEVHYSNYLAKRPLQDIKDELFDLKSAAEQALGPFVDQVSIEDTQLLRRLIARRCMYGIDLNQMAVNLTRLGVWIHTFVPGLALSYLDHNFVCGNSLIGIGQLQEINDKILEDVDTSSGQITMFSIDPKLLLGNAEEPLKRLALINDKTRSDQKRARKARIEAHEAIAPTLALCDIVTAKRILKEPLPLELSKWESDFSTIHGAIHHKEALDLISELKPVHFPITFPEVFLRKNPGFDVIIGNPPWEELMSDEDAFWARHFPGLRGHTQREKESLMEKLRETRSDLNNLRLVEIENMKTLRSILTSGPFPGMNTGDPDLYKAFIWRFWHLLTKHNGRMGVVLPRSAFYSQGSAEFRKEILSKASSIDVTMLVNNLQWIFDDVHPQYTIGLIIIKKSDDDKNELILHGPYNSKDKFLNNLTNPGDTIPINEVINWNSTASFPLLPSNDSIGVFRQIRKSPDLGINNPDSWRARPHRELDATNDKKYMDMVSKKCPEGFWPIYKGESFDLWNPDRGIKSYYAWGDPELLLPILQTKRINGYKSKRSAYAEFPLKIISDISTHPVYSCRISFRLISRATDTRTVRCALIPPNTFLASHGPFYLFPRGNELSAAYLLAFLSSIPFDWYARRFVEINMSFFQLSSFPVPRIKFDTPIVTRLINIAARLASIDNRYEKWASKIGVEYGQLEMDHKKDLIEELDAIVAHLYGLNQNQLIHIFETFHVGWNYEERLKNTIKHFKIWQQKL